jgi:uncharacterized protein YcfL
MKKLIILTLILFFLFSCSENIKNKEEKNIVEENNQEDIYEKQKNEKFIIKNNYILF